MIASMCTRTSAVRFVTPVSAVIFFVTRHVMLNAFPIMTNEFPYFAISTSLKLRKYNGIRSHSNISFNMIKFKYHLQIHLPKHPSSSSLLSPQSFLPSHFISLGKHLPFSQRKFGHPTTSKT